MTSFFLKTFFLYRPTVKTCACVKSMSPDRLVQRRHYVIGLSSISSFLFNKPFQAVVFYRVNMEWAFTVLSLGGTLLEAADKILSPHTVVIGKCVQPPHINTILFSCTAYLFSSSRPIYLIRPKSFCHIILSYVTQFNVYLYFIKYSLYSFFISSTSRILYIFFSCIITKHISTVHFILSSSRVEGHCYCSLYQRVTKYARKQPKILQIIKKNPYKYRRYHCIFIGCNLYIEKIIIFFVITLFLYSFKLISF